MEFENILYEVRDGILYLTLNRPEVRNALSPEMWRDISAAVRQARLDDAVQVVVVTGAGDKALASGADIQELHDRYYMDQMIGTATTALKDLEDLYKPVICAVNGYALGGGCELAEACDIRVATRRSKFGQPEINLSIIPGAGGTQRLTRLVGISKAKELIYTARRIDAQEALRLGLVSRVVSAESLMEEALRLAESIGKNAPIAVRSAKEAIRFGRDASIEEGCLFEREAFRVLFETEDQKTGMGAFIRKEKNVVFRNK